MTGRVSFAKICEMKSSSDHLESFADSAYQAFMTHLLPGVEGRILGIRMPLLRAYAKQILQGDWRGYLTHRSDASHEEVLVRGLMIAQAKMDLAERFTWVRQYIPRIYSWALCDSFCSALKTARTHPGEWWSFLQPYFQSRSEYELRFAVVMSMLYFQDDAIIDDVLAKYAAIRHEGYYVKMAVAWAVSVAYLEYPEKVMTYLAGNALDRETHRLAIRKMCESSRISPARKKTLKRLTR